MADFPYLTSDELADLKAKAKAATPSPWQEKYGPDAPANFELAVIANVDGDADDSGRLKMSYTPVCEMADHEDALDNLSFIVAANPETILRLIAMIERQGAWQPIETAPKDGSELYGWFPELCGHHLRTRFDKKRGRFDMGCQKQPTMWHPCSQIPAPPSKALASMEPVNDKR